MHTRKLGSSDLEVSEIGLGCWQLGNDFGDISDSEAFKILDTAVENGINFLDTADVYGAGLSETRIGNWLKTQTNKPYIATKVGRDGALFPDGYSEQKVRKNIEGSIKRLGIEALDLVQLHCIPSEVLLDGEIFHWLENLQKKGLIKHYGASVEMLDEAQFCLQNSQVTSLQIIFNVFRQDAIQHILPKAAEKNVGIIVRLPLASGLLSGAMRKDRQFSASDHRNYNRDGAAFHVGETFNGMPFAKGVELADALKNLLPANINLLQLAMRWILDQPQVSTIIAGASKAQQVDNNAKCSQLPALPAALHSQLNDFYLQQVRQHIRGGI
ncbi:aldo/keto reductase [Catenovulum sediminis]|nr:aldo/keto reductase [Catenovulum sediminis]